MVQVIKTVGVLALQGAFAEHHATITHLAMTLPLKAHVTSRLVKSPEDLASVDALIIPGGESTTIALLARLNGLLDPLREFAQSKPVWGTCAGAILLAGGGVEGTKKGGQEVIGGVNIRVERNGWGSQLESFEADMDVPCLRASRDPFKGVFIRAPVILDINTPSSPTSSSREPVEIVARIPPSVAIPPSPFISVENDEDDPRRIVAVRQGNHLVTTFHPELTKDDRFHEYFLRSFVLREGPEDLTS